MMTTMFMTMMMSHVTHKMFRYHDDDDDDANDNNGTCDQEYDMRITTRIMMMMTVMLMVN